MNKELTEKQQENKKEDKKALGKFAIILVLAFVAGLAIGVGSVLLKILFETASTKETVINLIRGVAIYGGYVFTTVFLIISVVLYKKSRKEYTTWDEEDEDVLCRIETKLSFVLWFSNIIMYGTYFFFAVGMWAIDSREASGVLEKDVTGLFIALGAVFLHIVYGIVAACVIQQKGVNFGKELNPEKKGSVYDTKFQDKWLESCDEAERYTVYKCSFKTYKVMQIVGVVLWLICLVSQMFFGTGVFATIVVTIYLIVQTSAYSIQGIYFAKHPSEVMK